MLDLIELNFGTNCIKYSNMRLYMIQDAKEVVSFCEENKIPVYSLEAFRIFGEGIQPSLEHSIDFREQDNESCWQRALAFLCNSNIREYVFEIWHEGY